MVKIIPSLCLICSLSGLLVACGGGGGGSQPAAATIESQPPTAVVCDGQCAQDAEGLLIADVKRVLAQAASQADALGVKATIAVVDRVGNVLAVYRMSDICPSVELATTQPVSVSTGLE